MSKVNRKVLSPRWRTINFLSKSTYQKTQTEKGRMFFVLQQVPIYDHTQDKDHTQDNVAHCKCATQDK